MSGSFTGYWSNVGSTLKGFFWTAPKEVVTGTLHLVLHPGELIEATWLIYEHPELVPQAIWEDIKEKASHSEGQGQLAADAVLTLIPITKVKELARIAQLVKKFGKVLPDGVVARKGGFALPGGSATGGSFGRSAQVLDEAVDAAQSQVFLKHARRLGFSDDAINALPDRLRQYGNNIGETFSGGWADADQFLVGRWGFISTRNQRIMHELGHVLDDIANPGLFIRSGQSDFGWRGFYNAERVAYTTQYGFNPSLLTAFNATAQAYPIGTRAVVIGGATYAIYEWWND